MFSLQSPTIYHLTAFLASYLVLVTGDQSHARGQEPCSPSLTAQELTRRGNALAKKGNHVQAEPCHVMAVRKEPKKWQHWTNLGSVYQARARAMMDAGKESAASQYVKKSSAAFERALGAPNGPPDAQIHHHLAANYHYCGKKREAIQQLERLLLRSDAKPAARSRAHEMLGAFLGDPPRPMSEKQRKAHNELHDEGSKLVSPHLKLAGKKTPARLSPKVKRQLKRGIARLRAVLKINPRNWSTMWMLGKAYEALGDHRAAHRALRAAGAVHPYHPDIAREEAAQLLHLSRGSEALVVARRAVKYNPGDAGLMANVALCQLIRGDVRAAEMTAREALYMAKDDKVTRAVLRVILEVKSGKRERPRSLPIFEKKGARSFHTAGGRR